METASRQMNTIRSSVKFFLGSQDHRTGLILIFGYDTLLVGFSLPPSFPPCPAPFLITPSPKEPFNINTLFRVEQNFRILLPSPHSPSRQLSLVIGLSLKF